MSNSRGKTFRDVANLLQPLQHRLQNIYDTLGFELPEAGLTEIQDVRAATLMTCKMDIMINLALLNFISRGEQRNFTEEQFRSIIGFPNQAVPIWYFANKIGDYLRLSYVTMFQFRIENMLTNILAVLDETKASRGYLDKVDALLTILSLSDKERKLDIFRTLQFIRNSLHNNGTHNNRNLKITIDKYTYVFVKGSSVRCAGWHHILVAVEATLLVIEAILNSPIVRAIPEPISRSYVEKGRKGH